MSRYGRRSSNDDDMSGCLVYAIIAIIAMPIVGIYWAVAGDTEDKRAIGIGIIIFCIIAWIFSLFS